MLDLDWCSRPHVRLFKWHVAMGKLGAQAATLTQDRKRAHESAIPYEEYVARVDAKRLKLELLKESHAQVLGAKMKEVQRLSEEHLRTIALEDQELQLLILKRSKMALQVPCVESEENGKQLSLEIVERSRALKTDKTVEVKRHKALFAEVHALRKEHRSIEKRLQDAPL
jgi:hypothetical protein